MGVWGPLFFFRRGRWWGWGAGISVEIARVALSRAALRTLGPVQIVTTCRTAPRGRAEGRSERLPCFGGRCFSVELPSGDLWPFLGLRSWKHVFVLNQKRKKKSVLMLLWFWVLLFCCSSCCFLSKSNWPKFIALRAAQSLFICWQYLWFGQELPVCTERLIWLMAAWAALDRPMTELVQMLSKCALVMRQV